MTTPTTHDDRKPEASPYCSDPNCKFCNELRNAQKQVKNGTAELSQKRAS